MDHKQWTKLIQSMWIYYGHVGPMDQSNLVCGTNIVKLHGESQINGKLNQNNSLYKLIYIMCTGKPDGLQGIYFDVSYNVYCLYLKTQR